MPYPATLHRSWRLAVYLLMAVALALGVAACGPQSSDAPERQSGTPVPGGTYNFPLIAEPVAIEPLNAQETEGIQVAHQVFQGLVGYELQDDGSLEVVPRIAESWEVDETATEFTFTLRRGVLFQPPVSREVTAQDFVDSWTRATDPANQSPVSYILAPLVGVDDSGYQTDPAIGLTGVEAVDQYTLRVQLRYPFAEFVQTLGHPVAAVTPVDHVDEVGDEAFAEKPVGTGPYMVAEWKHNQAVDLVRNPDYWDAENVGYVDRIHMPVITDTTTMWLSFQKGDLDFTSVPPGQVKVAENHSKVRSGEWAAKRWPSLSVSFLGINMSDDTLGYPAGEEGAKARQALTRAADRTAVIAIAGEGVPLPATGIVPPGVPGYTKGQEAYSYDPDEASALVEELGPLPTLAYWYNTDSAQQKTGEVLQAGWKAVGIQTALTSFEAGTFLTKLAEGDRGSGSQIFRCGWGADYPSMDSFLYPLFHSQQSGATSFTFYSDPEVDALLLQARSTVDEGDRNDLYQEAEQRVLEAAPVIPLTFYRDFRVMSSRVRGQVLDPLSLVDMWNVWVAK